MSDRDMMEAARAIALMEGKMAVVASAMLEELRSSCGEGRIGDLDIPGSGELFDENTTIEEIRERIAIGRECAKTPWGKNARENKKFYTCHTGHTYAVKPRAESDQGDDTAREALSGPIRAMQEYLADWMQRNGWGLRQGEVSERLVEEGECFDVLYFPEGGEGELSFVEATDLALDPNSRYQDAEERSLPYRDELGVRWQNDILNRRVGYFVDGGDDGSGQWIRELQTAPRDASGLVDFELLRSDSQEWSVTGQLRAVLLGRRRNVTSRSPRGLTFYWEVREELKYAKTLLSNLMRVSTFQSTFGAIRTIRSNMDGDAVRSMLNSGGGGKVGQDGETFDQPQVAVVTKPSTVDYEFPETGASNENMIMFLDSLLRSCAAGLSLPEFMLTMNVSQGNFASTLVSEGPFHKAVGYWQNQMSSEDLLILDQVLRVAAVNLEGIGFTVEDVDRVRLIADGPIVQTRNRMEEWEIHRDAWSSGRISGKTLNTRMGWAYEEEQAQRRSEQREIEPPLTENPGTCGTPGPDPDNRGDQMREPGVLSGDPGRTSPADNQG